MKYSKLALRLRKILRRLSLDQTRFLAVNEANLSKALEKIEKKGSSTFTQKDKEIISEKYNELRYFQGKMMAYWYVVNQLVGEKNAHKFLFQGLEGEKNYDKYGNKIKK